MVNESGDFALTEQYESARQDITNRMHSQKENGDLISG